MVEIVILEVARHKNAKVMFVLLVAYTSSPLRLDPNFSGRDVDITIVLVWLAGHMIR